MSDIFDEAEETLRTQKWTDLAKKSAPWIAGFLALALLVTVGVWGYNAWQTDKALKSSDAYEQALEAAQKGDLATAKKGFEGLAETGTGTYKALALQHLAGLALSDNKVDEAVAHLDAAAKATKEPIISDLAALKAAYLVMDKGSFADVEKRLTPLTKEGRPYAAMASEALALAKFQNGDVDGAKADLNALALSLDAPDGVKQRAAAQVQAIESGAGDVAKAVMGLPEAKPVPPATLQPAQPPAQ